MPDAEVDPAVQWLESVAMRPMLEALLEAVCKDKPDRLLNYAIEWMRNSYSEAAAEAAAAAEESGEWAPRHDVDATPEDLMAYLQEISATVVLEGIIESAIRKQPMNVVAYVVDELAAMRANEGQPTETMAAEGAADDVQTPAGVATEMAMQAATGSDPRCEDLLAAIGDGDLELVGELLQKGVPTDCKGASGLETPLIMAAEGEEECLRLLLEHGASIDYQNRRGETALMAAVKYGDAEIVRLLLESGADPNFRDVVGASCVDHAHDYGNDDVLELIDPAGYEQKQAQKAAEAASKPRKAANRRGSVSSESVDPKTQVDLSSIPVVEKSEDVQQRIEAVISSHLLFKDIDIATRKAVIMSMRERPCEEGEAIITQGEDGDFFYIVDAGHLDCYVRREGDEPPGTKVKEYGPSTSFGELALMYNTPRAATIVAGAGVVLFAIEREVFRSLILSSFMRKRQRFETILEGVPLLASMNSYERSILADGFEEQLFPAGQHIISEGEEGSTFYILVEGECIATQHDPTSGTPLEVNHYESGGYFGELALLRNDVRAASVVAQTDCRCILLDKWSFERLLGPVHDILDRDASSYQAHL